MARRVEEAIHVWTSLLDQTSRDVDDERESKNMLPDIQPIPLEIRIASQVITVIPSVVEARNALYVQLFAWHGIITSQTRITVNRFQVRLFNIIISV